MKTFKDIQSQITQAHYVLNKAGIENQTLLFELDPEDWLRFIEGVNSIDIIIKDLSGVKYNRNGEIQYLGHIVRPKQEYNHGR